jgi:hypothetical protein
LEAAPGPFFRFLDQATLNWVAVDVTELLYELGLCKNVEVVVAALPKLRAVAFEVL